MTDTPIEASDPAGEGRRQRVGQLYVRGLRARRISLVLHVDEATIRDEVAALRAEWTAAWGSVEIGECLATYRAIDAIASRQADRPALTAPQRCRFARLALTAADRECALGARVGGIDGVPAQMMMRASYVRQYVAAVKQALANPEPPPVVRPEVDLDDRRRDVERLLVHRRSHAQIARFLGVASATIAADVAALQAHWITAFGSVEAGTALARYRDAAERMLDVAVQSGRSGRDPRPFLQSALVARDREVALLALLGRLDAARQARQTPRPTPEAIAKIRASWDEPLYTPEEVADMFRYRTDVRSEECDAMLALRKGSSWWTEP